MNDDRTLEEKLKAAAYNVRQEIAEKHFFDASQPHFPGGFSVGRRDRGHWDIYADQAPGKVAAFLSLDEKNQTMARDGGTERAFCIRGEPGDVIVRDERWNPYIPHPRGIQKFRSVMAAMLWIAEELMQEPDE